MAAKRKVASTARPRKKSPLEPSPYDRMVASLEDDVGEIAHSVGIVETLAVAAVEVAGRVGDDATCRRRLGDLAVQIENAASEAFATARALDARVRSA